MRIVAKPRERGCDTTCETRHPVQTEHDVRAASGGNPARRDIETRRQPLTSKYVWKGLS